MHQAKIDAAPASGVIRVTASEENAYSVAGDVKVALQRIQRMALDLRPVRAMLPDDESRQRLTHEAALKSIARVTGVAIELQDRGDTVRHFADCRVVRDVLLTTAGVLACYSRSRTRYEGRRECAAATFVPS